MKKMKAFVLFVVLATFMVLPPIVQGQNYPQFRGENSDALSPEPLPKNWSDMEGTSKNIQWKISIPGEGWSQPIVWNDRVYLTAAVPASEADRKKVGPEEHSGGYGRDRRDLVKVEYKYNVYCIDANSGDQIWERTVKQGKPPIPRHSTNTYATETPITDGQRIYAYFGMNGVHCLDMDGNILWQKDLGAYKMRADWGTASSPALLDNRLFVQVDNEEQSFLAALNVLSGDELWRVERDEASQYSSPYVWRNSLRNEVVLGGMVYRSYDPATGKLLWQLDMNRGRSSATPVAVDDRLYVGNELRNRGGADDGGGQLFRIRPGGSGDITPAAGANTGPYVDWRNNDSGIQMASPTFLAGNLYFFQRRGGIVHCVDMETGQVEYKSRVRGAGAFWASPWADGQHLFAMDSRGNTHVIAAGDEFKVVSVNKLDQHGWGTPAIAGGRIFLRTASKLYCIADSQKK